MSDTVKRNRNSNRIPALLAAAGALLLFTVRGLPAADLATVVSSDSGPYAEALEAFKAALRIPSDFYDASSPDFTPPEDATHVVAFGARAAAVGYPPGTHLVYALAPVNGRSRDWHEISMLPPPAEAIAAYKGLQPGLKRLAVFWAAYPGEAYLNELHKEGEKAGITILSAKLKGPDSFPERLRRLMGKIDAFWLMPDPVLINKNSLMVLASFSCANSIPFYAPTYALVQNGATASFSSDFSESGRAAAKAITSIYTGGEQPRITYPEKPLLRVNGELAAKCNWPIKK